VDAQQTEKIILWLGESVGFWVQTGAFLFSAFGAIAIIYNNSHQAKKRATVDLVLHENQNERLIKSKRRVTELHEGRHNFTQLACCEKLETEEDNEHILAVLNNYEFIASGIKEGAFDEEIYKRMKRSLAIKHWDALSAYIAELRRTTQREKLYVEFEWLVGRWKKSQIMPNTSILRRIGNWFGL